MSWMLELGTTHTVAELPSPSIAARAGGGATRYTCGLRVKLALSSISLRLALGSVGGTHEY